MRNFKLLSLVFVLASMSLVACKNDGAVDTAKSSVEDLRSVPEASTTSVTAPNAAAASNGRRKSKSQVHIHKHWIRAFDYLKRKRFMWMYST